MLAKIVVCALFAVLVVFAVWRETEQRRRMFRQALRAFMAGDCTVIDVSQGFVNEARNDFQTVGVGAVKETVIYGTVLKKRFVMRRLQVDGSGTRHAFDLFLSGGIRATTYSYGVGYRSAKADEPRIQQMFASAYAGGRR